MYESLKNCTMNFHLYVFAFDDSAFEILRGMELKNVTVISLQEFEDEELLGVKNQRTIGEYCWTCTPSIIKYCLDHFQLESCTYLDADLYFFKNPQVLINEVHDKSVLITEHRYTPEYDQSHTSGIYCVQFMTFKNDDHGNAALDWWRSACIDWCYARFEDGKFGDQKYLDDWPVRFSGVHVLEHTGGGVAPWNIQQFDLSQPDNNLVFYHFHGYKNISEKKIDLGNYKINSDVVRKIYSPYVKHLEKFSELEKRMGIIQYERLTLIERFINLITSFKRFLKGNYNVYNKKDLLRYH